MTKVLFVCEYATLNGGERSLLAVLSPLIDSGVECSVACPSAGDLRRVLAQKKIETFAFDVHQPGGARRSGDELRGLLKQIILQVAPDVVHANSLSMSRLCGPVTAELGVAGIGHLRDIINLSRRAISDINRNARVLAVSRATRDWHIQRGLTAERTHVCYNGIDTQQFRPRPRTGWLHREIRAPADAPLVVTMGQLGPRKGIDVLLQAARMVVRQAPRVHFVVVGARTSAKAEVHRYEADLQAVSQCDELRGRCHLLGRREDIPGILNEAAMLAHAARQEPLGRVLLEAAATAIPIVATDVGGTREIFSSPDHGALLVPPDDPQQLATAIARILSADDDWRKQFGDAARRMVQQRFTTMGAATELQRHYAAAEKRPKS